MSRVLTQWLVMPIIGALIGSPVVQRSVTTVLMKPDSYKVDLVGPKQVDGLRRLEQNNWRAFRRHPTSFPFDLVPGFSAVALLQNVATQELAPVWW